MMASGGEFGLGAPVVLRVKRKREDEPADTLVVSKTARLDPLLSETDQKIFHFAATVREQKQTDQEVLAQIAKNRPHSSLVKLSSFSSLTVSDQQKQRREAKKELVATQRFKLVSECRLLKDGALDSADTKEQISQDDFKEKSVHVYDLEQEAVDEPQCDGTSRPSAHQQSQGDSDKEASTSSITCNSTPMVREKLNGSSDFVYDLYYTKTCSIQEMMSCNWNSISAQSYQPELVHDITASDEEECYEDEDDSNDEGNWRNEYPDEESASGRSSCSEEEVDSLQYRYREAYLGDMNYEDEDGFLDGSYWNQS